MAVARNQAQLEPRPWRPVHPPADLGPERETKPNPEAGHRLQLDAITFVSGETEFNLLQMRSFYLEICLCNHWLKCFAKTILFEG